MGEGTRAYYFLQAFNTRPRYASCVTQGAQSALAIGSKRLYRLNPQTEETVSNEERTVVAIDDAVCTLALNPVKPLGGSGLYARDTRLKSGELSPVTPVKRESSTVEELTFPPTAEEAGSVGLSEAEIRTTSTLSAVLEQP